MDPVRILVVEDEGIVAEDLRRRLTSLGYFVVDSVATGERALASAALHLPDLVLMDIMLQGDMDGITTAEHMLQLRDIPIIYVTAYADDRTLERAKITEPYGYILKPFERRELHTTIEIALYKHRMERRVRDSERWFSTTLRSIGDAVITTDDRGRVTFMNKIAERLTGWSMDESRGRDVGTVFVATDQSTLSGAGDVVREILLTKQPLEMTNHTVLRTRSGEDVPIDKCASPIRDEKGRVQGVVIVFRDVTERRHAQQAVLKSRNHYRTLLEDFPTMIWQTDAAGGHTYFNQTWLRFRGTTLEEELDATWHDDILAEDRARYRDVRAKALEQQSVYDTEFRLRCPDGTYRWIAEIGRPYEEIDGGFAGFIGSCMDVTEWRKADETIRQLRSSVDASGEVVFMTDREGIFTFINPEFTRLYGYTAEEVLDKATPRILKGTGLEPEHDTNFWEDIIQEKTFHGEMINRTRDGRLLSVESSVDSVLDDRGNVVGFLAIQRDISGRKAADEALRQSEERFRRLIEASPDGIMLTDTAGVIEIVNRQTAMQHGYDSPEDLLGQVREACCLVHPDDAERLQSDIAAMCADGQNRRGEYCLMLRDGAAFPAEVSFSLLRTASGAPSKIITITRDVTQRKWEEMELISAKEKAEESDRLKDAFLRNVSHEIRTPLNIIIGFAELLEMELEREQDTDKERYFDSIKRASERLMRTVELILNISSLQAGTFRLSCQPIDLVEHVRKIVNDYQPLARDRNLLLAESSETESAPIFADAYSLDQALANVIDNAIKFTSEGGVSIQVYRDDASACVSITDTGVGISREYLPEIFSVFSQEDAAYTRPFDGIGLGLSLTRQYVQQNGGTIDVESMKGGGTTVTMHFPLRECVPEDVASAASAPAGEAFVPNVRKDISILVVEDDGPTQSLMNVLLSRYYTVYFAESADEALIILNSKPIELVLMDLSIPGEMDGLQLTRHLRSSEQCRNLPIIALTGHAFELDRKNAVNAGCDAFLTKPFQIAKLTELVQSMIGEDAAMVS